MPNDASVDTTPNLSQKTSEKPISQDTESHTPHQVIHLGNTPGKLILQWLTYAFWGWTLLALYWLIGMSLRYFIGESAQRSSSYEYGITSAIAYPLAAVIVLGIISLICDVTYSRNEPKQKTGAATVIMVVHAVIFALAAIGSLIVAVFSVISMVLSINDNSNGSLIIFITSIIMAFLYGATLLRTLSPVRFRSYATIYKMLMAIVIVGVSIASVAGPIAYAQKTRTDRAIETGLPEIARGVNAYANENKKLPQSLKNIDLRDSVESARSLVNEKKVTYTALERIKSRTLYKGYSQIGDDNNPVYHYKLCVEYVGDTSNSNLYEGSSSSSRYRTTPSTYAHNSGKVCYDLQTDY